MKFVEAANNFNKLAEVRKKFAKFVNSLTTLRSLWDSQTTFMNFAEAANNFTKLVGLANNVWKVCKTTKNFMKFVDWKVRFKCLNIFLYLGFTHSNILIGKHKCFMNAFYVS